MLMILNQLILLTIFDCLSALFKALKNDKLIKFGF